MILHVVFYQPKASATEAERQALVSSLTAACLEIPSIKQVRVGKAVDLGMGYENRSQASNMDYVATFEFIDQESLKAYLGHEKHQMLAKMFWSVCESTMIVDVDAVDPRDEGAIDVIGQTIDNK